MDLCQAKLLQRKCAKSTGLQYEIKDIYKMFRLNLNFPKERIVYEPMKNVQTNFLRTHKWSLESEPKFDQK